MKITPDEKKDTIKAKTKKEVKYDPRKADWWNANSKQDLMDQMLSVANYLKTNQNWRIRQASQYSRLYGNVPLMATVGVSFNRFAGGSQLPMDRPTMNVIQSCTDTLVSRITQNKPRPVFLTDNGDSKMRTLAKQMNQFILGEFYQTQAYRIGTANLTESCVLGTGCVQVYEDPTNKRVALDRVLQTELYVDQNEAMYKKPRQLFRLKLIDRSVLEANFPEKSAMVRRATQSYPSVAIDSGETVSDQVMVCEAWHLRSGKGSASHDGMHVIACSSGILLDEAYERDKFPFAFLGFNPRLLGFWDQPLAEQLFGTQNEINKLLITISKSINLVGVPRIFVEQGSKVAASGFNNEIGSIIKYTGVMPQFSVAPCMAPEIYAQLQRLIEYAYQQSGISTLAAQGKKPAGLNSGAALRENDDIQNDRFSALQTRYENYYVDVAYLMIEQAREIAERDGKYQTVYPDKDGTREINLPDAKLLDNPFVIRCYDTSSLPKDPAGRKEYIIEMMQAGIYSPQEGRRLLGFSDTEQEDKLQTAAEERILKQLDLIVEDGKFTPPDEFTDIQLAQKIVAQYYNLYEPAKLSESRVQMLRDYKKRLDDLVIASMPPAPMPGMPTALPAAPPVNPMIPNVPQ